MPDIKTKVMTFTGPSAVDASFVVSGIEHDGVPFTPVGARITTDGSTSFDVVSTDVWSMSGFCDSALVQRVISTNAPDSATTTSRSGSIGNFILLRTNSSTVACEASITAFGSGTCTLNFSTVAASAQGVIFHVVFFGGADAQSELVQRIATTANAVTGVSFQPEFVFSHTHSTGADNTYGNRQMSCGVFNGALQQMCWTMWGGYGDGTTLQLSKEIVVRSGSFISELTGSGTSYNYTIASITSDGFTWTGGLSSDVVDFLCFNFGGANTDIRTIAKSTATAPVDQSLSLAFNKPAIVELWTGNKTVETPETTSSFGIGLGLGTYDGDNGAQMHTYLTDGQGAVENRDKRASANTVLSCGTADAVQDWVATAKPVSTASPAQITLNPNDATAAIIGVWAIESQLADPVASSDDEVFFLGIF